MKETLNEYTKNHSQKMKNDSLRNKIIAISLSILLPFFFYLLCLNHVDINEIGVTYHSNTGEISIQEKPGWYFTDVFTKVITIETSPFFVDINFNCNLASNNPKTITRKLVRFDPAGVKDFVTLHGVSYLYNIRTIMTGYAFSGNKYSFLEILEQK